MTERKQTPDLLGELLGGGASGPTPVLAAPPPRDTTGRQPASRPAVAQPAAAAQPAAKEPVSLAPKATVAPRRWEYLVISFQEYKGWRPRYRNGEKIANWEDQPLLHDYLNQLGAEGWELAGASAGRALYGSRDEYQLFCKRASSAA